MSNVNPAIARIQEAIEDLPWEAAQAVWDSVPSTTPMGMALRVDAGTTLVEHFRSMTPEAMGIVSERIIEANKAIGSQLEHTPHLPSLLTIISATAEMSDDEQAFYTGLQTVVPAIPGFNDKGEPMAFHKLYDKGIQNPEFDVIANAREALSDPNISEEDADYWWGLIHKEFPEMRNEARVPADEIPYSQAELTAQENAQSMTDVLGESAGKLLQSLGYSNRSGLPEDDGVMTLEKAQALNAQAEDDLGVMDPANWVENQVEGDPHA